MRLVIMTGLCGGLVGTALANQNWLPLRSEPGTCAAAGTAAQTIETQWGNAVATLPFTGTTTYDFYSPALTQAVNMVTSYKGGGVVYMQNTSSSQANNFSVTAEMQFFDYDPGTGAQVLLADTAASAAKNINRGQTVNWALINGPVVTNLTMGVGHLLHVALTITLVSGNPGGFGFLQYNGPANASTVATLPQNISQVLDWPFGTLSAPVNATITATPSVPANSTGNTASVPGPAGATYTWSITNGTITAGQGTSQIVWTAGANGPVSLQVVVTTGCTSTGSASVSVYNSGISLPQTIIAIVPQPDGSVKLTCGGVWNANYLLQATTTLDSPVWSTLSTNTVGNDGIFTWVDANATNYPQRFYRTTTP